VERDAYGKAALDQNWLVASSSSVSRQSPFVHADQLQQAVERNEYGEAAHLIEAVQQLAGHFQSFVAIPKVAELSGRVATLQRAVQVGNCFRRSLERWKHTAKVRAGSPISLLSRSQKLRSCRGVRPTLKRAVKVRVGVEPPDSCGSRVGLRHFQPSQFQESRSVVTLQRSVPMHSPQSTPLLREGKASRWQTA